ncbi:MAG: response regulator transcription factor [Pseudomonadota bacterium]
MPDRLKALVIEDDPLVRRTLKNVLEEEGYHVIDRENGDGVVDLVKAESFGIVTLDVQLGGRNGFDILRDIRAVSEVPVIMVTGRGDVFDRVVGLEIGADDYITKPFHVREVLARIRAVARRKADTETTRAQPVLEQNRLMVDGLCVDLDGMGVTGRDGSVCELTAADFKLLKIFLDRPRRQLSRDQLMDLIGGTTWSPLDRTIDNQVARLRKKIERNPAEPQLIKTVRGVGYVFTGDITRVASQSGPPKRA